MDLQDKLAALVVSVAGDVKALLMALANKQDKLNSGTSIKTLNGASVLGGGDIALVTQAEFDATLGDISAALTAINGA